MDKKYILIILFLFAAFRIESAGIKFCNSHFLRIRLYYIKQTDHYE